MGVCNSLFSVPPSIRKLQRKKVPRACVPDKPSTGRSQCPNDATVLALYRTCWKVAQVLNDYFAGWEVVHPMATDEEFEANAFKPVSEQERWAAAVGLQRSAAEEQRAAWQAPTDARLLQALQQELDALQPGARRRATGTVHRKVTTLVTPGVTLVC